MLRSKNCENCNKEFYPSKKQGIKYFEKQRFCSLDCSYDARRIKNASNKKDSKICPGCKKVFHKNPKESWKVWNKQVFCTRDCKNNYKPEIVQVKLSDVDIWLSTHKPTRRHIYATCI